MRNCYSLSLAIFFISSTIFCASAQEKVTFQSSDGLTITADNYVSSTQNPYIILLHQAGYSRGEYREIAPKLIKLGYNCLAVDLRSGKEVNFIENETATLAKEKNLPCSYLDALTDIHAAIDFVKQRTTKPIVLWGSSYSASLSLMIAPEELKVGALVVFSPGEYFNSDDFVKSKISKISIPILALSSKSENSDLTKLLTVVKKPLVTIFKPSKGEGKHGSGALWVSNPNNQEYWMAVTVFFSKLKK